MDGWMERKENTPAHNTRVPAGLSSFSYRDAPHAADGHVHGHVAQLFCAERLFQVLEAGLVFFFLCV
jgi:hypothetical protein